MKLTIATRKSVLALWQTNFVKQRLQSRGHSVEILPLSTKGDKILDTPLAKIGGKGLFTKELENAMLRGEAQLAVHSLKDVPTQLPQGLVLGAICEREDAADALLSQKFASLGALPKGARVGTTSLRRQMQLLALRPDLEITSLRGNVQSRLAKLNAGEFDAIVLAMAGVNRLELKSEVAFISPLPTICAMGQAAIGVECVEDLEVMRALEFLNDEKTACEVGVERAFVERLQGGCQAPIGVFAQLLEGKMRVSGILGLPNGEKILRDAAEFEFQTLRVCDNTSRILEVGREFAERFLRRGAAKILQEAVENF